MRRCAAAAPNGSPRTESPRAPPSLVTCHLCAQPVPLLALPLLSGDLCEASEESSNGRDLTVDGWLTIQLSASGTQLVIDARWHAAGRW